MNYYIFITNEGYTYQPNTKSIEPDCDNSQVLGIASGNNEDEAFKNLKIKNKDLLDTNFNELFCYKLDADNIIKYFNLKQK